MRLTYARGRALKVAERYFRPGLVGRLEHLLKPHLGQTWGGPFNGQVLRRELFESILSQLPLEAIVETGTHRGATTEYLLQHGLPVYSIELDERYFGFARARLKGSAAQIFCGDSREFLSSLADAHNFPRSAVFFYLDSHWGLDWPLEDELQIIFDKWARPVVMIDDFEVPNSSYGYDAYGEVALNLEYVAQLPHTSVATFFPAKPASEETGAKRGCVVLCKDRQTRVALDNLRLLRQGPRLGDIRGVSRTAAGALTRPTHPQ